MQPRTKSTLTTGLLIALAVAFSGPATAAEREVNETTTFPGQPDKKLQVDVGSLDVSLRAADVKTIEVGTDLRISNVTHDWADDWITRHTPTFEDASDLLKITARPGKGRFIWLGHLTARARLTVVAPLSIVPDLTTESGAITARGDFSNAKPMYLRTSKGNIEFSGAAHSLDIRTTTGDSDIEVIRPIEKLFVRNSSGNVNLIGGAREVEIDSASGSVWLSNLSGSAKVVSATGKVTLRWDRLDPEHQVIVRTSSERINIVLPRSVRPRGVLKTTTGTIRCDFPGTVSDAGDAVELSGDGPRLDVATASGEIILSQSDL